MLIPVFNMLLHRISYIFVILINIEEFILKVLCIWSDRSHDVIYIGIWVAFEIVLTLISTSFGGRFRLGRGWLLELEVEVGRLEH